MGLEGCIIFIDEIDTLGGNRDNDGMHEASRRVLSALLRRLDSFESNDNTLLICATNRKKDLALLSRIDLSIEFAIPDERARLEIWKRYAKHLPEKDLAGLAQRTDGFSGRNIYEVCKDAERRWASKWIRKEVEQDLPTDQQYWFSIDDRKNQQMIF